MRNITKHLDKQFFLITRDNYKSIGSRLYGICYQDNRILANCNLDTISIKPHQSGCYNAVVVDKKNQVIRVEQDCCSSMFIYVYDNGSYWALSNSFFVLCDEVKKDHPLSLDEVYFEQLYSTGASVLTLGRTLAREIKVVPACSEARIDRNTGELSILRDQDFYQRFLNRIPLDSSEGMAQIDRWISRWASIIRGISRGGYRIKMDLTGGFDSRIGFALAQAAGLDLRSERVHVYSSDRRDVSGNSCEDYRIAAAISDEYGVPISSDYNLKDGTMISGEASYTLYRYSLANIHKEAYFPRVCYEQPVFYINGLNGEILRGLETDAQGYMKDYFSYPKEMEMLPVTAWKELFSDWDALPHLSDDEVIDQKEKDRLYFMTARSRSHMCPVMYQNYVLNYWQVTCFSDLDIVGLARMREYDSTVFNAVVLCRIDPRLLDFPISDNRSFADEDVAYAKHLCAKYRSKIHISKTPVDVISENFEFDQGEIHNNESPREIMLKRFDEKITKKLFQKKFGDYGRKTYEYAAKSFSRYNVHHSDQWASVIVTAMEMIEDGDVSERYMDDHMLLQDIDTLRQLREEYPDNEMIDYSYRKLITKQKKITVSLTSYPPRISSVARTIKTLLIQNMKADRIILWLAKEQFPKKDTELPDDLLALQKYGLEIRWCDDLKPHKKYYYVMQDHPDDIIITVDDDVYYSPRMIEALIHSYIEHPEAVSCLVANRISINDGVFAPYEDWPHDDRLFQGVPQMDIMPVGVGGVLYPPSILPEYTFDADTIKELCLYQDDLWLKVMEVQAGIPTVLARESVPFPDLIKEAQAVGLYFNKNQCENDEVLQKLGSFIDKKHNERDYLIRKIFKCESTASSGLPDRNNNKRLIQKLRNGFYIYGAGIGAEMVTECLLDIDEALKPKAILVTSMDGNKEEIQGCPVIEIGKAQEVIANYPIVISTGEKKHKAIRETLKEYQTGEQLYIKDAVMGKMLRGKREIKNAKSVFAYSLLEEGS